VSGRKRPVLRLVGAAGAPEDIFDDLVALRQGSISNSDRRTRIKETFARIPHDRGLELYRRIGSAAWVILIELDRLILKGRGRNPVRLTNQNLRAIGLTQGNKARALKQLEKAGVVTVERNSQGGRGKAPLVTHRWFPVRD
jgi:hypothetical protein